MTTELCRVAQCDREPHIRGLCAKCYGNARNAVKKGETSWNELIELGLATTSSRRRGSLFQTALRNAKETL